MSEYYVRSTAGGKMTRYHTKECGAFPSKKHLQVVDEQYIEQKNLSLCKRCSGEEHRPDTQRRSLRTKLETGEL